MCATKETCSLHNVWQDLRSAIDDLLEKRTLGDLMKFEGTQPDLVQLTKRDRDEVVS